jgi:hypothetical protein
MGVNYGSELGSELGRRKKCAFGRFLGRLKSNLKIKK